MEREKSTRTIETALSFSFLCKMYWLLLHLYFTCICLHLNTSQSNPWGLFIYKYFTTFHRGTRRRSKIRLIKGNAKCCHLKKLSCKGTLRQVFICLRLFQQNPIPPPPYTLYTYLQYTYSHGGGGEGGELNQREWERVNRGEYGSQSWVENTNMTECTQDIGCLQSINSDKHLPQSPFTSQFY